MTKKSLALILMILLLAISSTGCDLLFTPTSTLEPTWTWAPQPTEPESTITAAAATRDALRTQLAISPTFTRSPLPPTITLTPTPATPTLTYTPGPTLTASNTPLPCNQLEFIGDVTIPDNTLMEPATIFQKTWRVKNTGSCTWGNDYKLVYDSGDKLSGPDWSPLSGTVAPGESVDITLDLRTPLKPGTYTSNWMLQSRKGENFYLLYVKIKSGSRDTTFRVNYVQVDVDSPSYSGACPHTFNFTGSIVTTNAGDVTYYWERSDGQKTGSTTLHYSKADLKIVTYTWKLSKSGFNWVKIVIESPNNQGFTPKDFTLNCTP